MDIQSISSHPSSSMDWSQTNLAIFPEEKICDIFSHLRAIDLKASTVFVCKQWSRISSGLLIKADNPKYQETRESIEYLIKLLHVEAGKSSPTARSLENLLGKNRDEITFSFTLKREAVKILAERTLQQVLGAATRESYHDYIALSGGPIKNKLAEYLLAIVWNIHDFESWRNNDTMKDELTGVVYPAGTVSFMRIHTICLDLIKLSDFDRAAKFALEVKSSIVEFSGPAEKLKEEVFANLAMALTKQGYIEKALEILDKDIYPGSPEKNLKYKSYVWTFISPELKQLNYNYQ